MRVSKKFAHISKSALFDFTTQLIGEVYVNSQCVLKGNCVLDASLHRIILKKGCQIGQNTRIYAISDRLVIGEETIIGENCEILVSIGARTKIGNSVKIEEGAIVGDDCVIFDDVTILQDSIIENSSSIK